MNDIGQRIKELREEIQKRNLALLIVHHANDEGGARGGESVLTSVDLTIRMANCPLKELGSNDEDKSHLKTKESTEPFGIIRLNGNDVDDWVESRFDGFFNDEDETWHVFCGNDIPEIYEARILKEAVEHYRSRGFNYEVIAKMLGTTDNTLRKKLEEAKRLLRGNNIK